MIEKEYYRLDELEKRLNLSFSDLRYLVENKKVELAFRLDKNKFIIGGWLEGKGFVGYGSIYYSGFVKVNKDKQLELLQQHKIKCKYFRLVNKTQIIEQNNDYPFKTPTPHTFLYGWKPTPIQAIDWTEIPAKLFPQEREHTLLALGNTFYDVMKSINNKLPEKNQSEAAKTLKAKIPKVEFYSEGIEFCLNDVCLIASEINTAIGTPSEKSTTQGSTNYHRPIDILILKMLEQFPNDKPSHTWERLKDDLNQEPRKFDTDEIIDEIGEEILYWFDTQAEVKQMKKKSFYNLIKKLKIN